MTALRYDPETGVFTDTERKGIDGFVGYITCAAHHRDPTLGHTLAAALKMREALAEAPIMSKYHGPHGFMTAIFMADYETWRVKARAALAKANGETP